MYHRMYQFFVLIFAVFIFSTASAEASSDQLKMKDLLSIVSIDEGNSKGGRDMLSRIMNIVIAFVLVIASFATLHPTRHYRLNIFKHGKAGHRTS